MTTPGSLTAVLIDLDVTVPAPTSGPRGPAGGVADEPVRAALAARSRGLACGVRSWDAPATPELEAAANGVQVVGDASSDAATLREALARLDASPVDTVVVSDRSATVEAARAAGAHSVGIGHADALPGADHHLPVLTGPAVAAIVDRLATATRVRDDELALRHGWRVEEATGHRPGGFVALGSNTMTGNGYLGHRGTFPEWGAEAHAACVVSDTYDTADGKWTELVSVPDALRARWFVDDRGAHSSLGLDSRTDRDDVDRALAIRHGLTELAIDTAMGRLATERFAHLTDLHQVHQRQSLRPRRNGEVVLEAAIDGEVWSMNGDHFATYEAAGEPGGVLTAAITTPEHGTTIVVGQALRITGAEVLDEQIVSSHRRTTRRVRLAVTADQQVVVHTVMAVTSDNDGPAPFDRAVREAAAGRDVGWAASLTSHAAAWERVWADGDVVIEGDPLSQVALRFGTYHNVIATPRHSERLPIGARGLSCQAYQGAAFWDQEAFNLPYFLFTDPPVARRVLRYRVHTLDGAKRKAARLGYDGAFYAWVSGKTGDELCPDFFFKDVLTDRWVRNHFNDWQMHISPDLVTAIDDYLSVTGDTSLLDDGGAEVIVEVARFLASFVLFRPGDGHYHCVRLLGPDEYHENVDDNAFTNHQVRAALRIALRLGDRLDALGVDEVERALWADIVDRLFLPVPDPDTLVIEQFRRYHDLENTTPEAVASRLKDPHEYWGWPNGVAVHTQVIKQADVVQLFVMQPGAFDLDVMAANVDHYLPRTQHGSSLSPSAYAIVAAWLGRTDVAREQFLAGATVDLLSLKSKTSGGTFIGGIRTAAAAGSWLVVVRGFLGVRVDGDGLLRVDPHLPSEWTRVRAPLIVRGQRVVVDALSGEVSVAAGSDNTEPVRLRTGGTALVLDPGETRRLAP